MEGNGAEPIDIDAEEFAAKKRLPRARRMNWIRAAGWEVSRRLQAVAEACAEELNLNQPIKYIIKYIKNKEGVCGKLLSSVNPSSQ